MTGEADVDGHQREQIDAFDQWQNRFERGQRVHHKTGAAAQCADRIHGAEGMRVERFGMG